MSARLTYRNPAYSTGAQVEPLPHLREKYGPVIAEIIETTRTMLQDQPPRSQDIRQTLVSVRDWPAQQAGKAYRPVPWDNLDELSRGMILRQALTVFGTVESLDDEQLRFCAAQALVEFKSSVGGRPTSEPLVVEMLRQLARASPNMTVDERLTLTRDALRCCGVGSSDDNIDQLLKEARREAIARGAPLPRAKRGTRIVRRAG